MSQSPIVETLAGMKAKLESAIEVRRDAEKQISEYSSAIRALALVCEDDEVKVTYLNFLEELGGKPGFLAAIRSMLRTHSNGLTPGIIRAGIQVTKLMDLSGYSNPLASIHTTLRRMVESGEVEPFVNEKGEKAYRVVSASTKPTAARTNAEWEQAALTGGMTRPPAPRKQMVEKLNRDLPEGTEALLAPRPPRRLL